MAIFTRLIRVFAIDLCNFLHVSPCNCKYTYTQITSWSTYSFENYLPFHLHGQTIWYNNQWQLILPQIFGSLSSFFCHKKTRVQISKSERRKSLPFSFSTRKYNFQWKKWHTESTSEDRRFTSCEWHEQIGTTKDPLVAVKSMLIRVHLQSFPALFFPAREPPFLSPFFDSSSGGGWSVMSATSFFNPPVSFKCCQFETNQSNCQVWKHTGKGTGWTFWFTTKGASIGFVSRKVFWQLIQKILLTLTVHLKCLMD